MRSAGDLALKVRRLTTGTLWRLGWLLRLPAPSDLDPQVVETVKRVRRFTMTTPQRIAALCDGVTYLAENRIAGAIVECGVWRGGSMMAAALTLLRLGDAERDLYLFDTFAGMPPPGTNDQSSAYDGYSIHKRWQRTKPERAWHLADVEHVKGRVVQTGYPSDRVHMVKGMVEDTIPAQAPDRIALLRLDTDWYESTRHELEHLYPRLVPGGVLIIDDYGHYEGARRAVDEYFRRTGEPVLLNRIDYTGRIAIKRSP